MTLIDDLWGHVEKEGQLSAPLVDAVLESDSVYGEMLLWCYQNNKWPGAFLGHLPSSKMYWFLDEVCFIGEKGCYHIPWLVGSTTKRDTARESYRDLLKHWVVISKVTL